MVETGEAAEFWESLAVSNSMIEVGDDNSLRVSVSLCSPFWMLGSTVSVSGLSIGGMFLLSTSVLSGLSVCSAGGAIRLVGGCGVTDMSSSTPNLSTGEGNVSAEVAGMSPMLFSLSSLVSKSP